MGEFGVSVRSSDPLVACFVLWGTPGIEPKVLDLRNSAFSSDFFTRFRFPLDESGVCGEDWVVI